MPVTVYPPSHRDTRVPQPEVCQLCGLTVPGHELVESDVEGLRGLLICPHCTDGARDRPSYQDRRRLNPVDYDVIGTGRVYPPGAPVEFWNPAAEGFSPLHIERPQLYLRNFGIPTTSPATRWDAGITPTPAAIASVGSVAYASNPFGFGARGLVFDSGDAFALEQAVTLSGALTIALAFRTGATLAGGINLLHEAAPGTSRLEILANGSLVFASATASDTVQPAGAFTTATNYLLVVQRTSGGDVTARKNAASAPSTASVPGSVALEVLHDDATAAVTFAELVVYERVLTATELSCLEHYLAGFVGVSA